jgi:CarD family transcriptional regulator
MPRKVKFKVGDAVFYPSAGVGCIESTEDVYISGQSEEFYVIRIIESGMLVKVPSANAGTSGLRPLVGPRKLKEVQKVLADKNAKRVTGGNWTERCKELERRINRGDTFELAAVVRDLLRWKGQTGLSFEESMLLETACNYLSYEIATVQKVQPEHAYQELVKHVAKTASKAEVA